jgi:hypothetical protein
MEREKMEDRSDIAERLGSWAQNQEMIDRNYTEHGLDCLNAIAEISRLKKKCDMQAMVLRRLSPDKFPDTYFIHAGIGKKDINNMPEKLLVCPAYGLDYSYVYEWSGKTTGTEW